MRDRWWRVSPPGGREGERERESLIEMASNLIERERESKVLGLVADDGASSLREVGVPLVAKWVYSCSK